MTELDVRTSEDQRVAALREAVAELLGGYAEAARVLMSVDGDGEVRDRVLAPLRRAADSAAATLAQAS